MNFIDVANQILKLSIENFNNTDNRMIPVDKIYEKYSNLNVEVINNAFRMLSKDGLVVNSWADNKVYVSELQLEAIIRHPDKSKLEKLYSILKEIRDWIPGY